MEMEMEREEPKRRRLMLVPAPFQGHINPMLQLATILRGHGFSITIAHTQFNSPNPHAYPDFTFVTVPDGLSDEDTLSNNSISIILRVNMNCETTLKPILSQGTGDEEVAGVIYDEMMYCVELVARSLGIPSIMFRTSNVATLRSRDAVFKLNEEGLIPVPDAMLEDLVPDHHPLRFKDLPFFFNMSSMQNFWKLLVNMSQIKTASAIIVNTIDCLEHEEVTRLHQQRQLPVFPVGPMHKVARGASSNASLIEEDTSCIEWLDKQEPESVIYISFGSIAWMEPDELAEMAQGLIDSKQRFLWVIRPGSVCGLQWIENALPENFGDVVGERGYIVKWAPQKNVLAHHAVRGFWSHCGWNSTLESICEGVPMICRPCFGDQTVTARYISEVWRIGLYYEDRLERGKVEKAVRRLMVEKEGNGMRKRAEELKEKVEASIESGGTSLNSLDQLVDFIRSFRVCT